jgi:uncharacterized protein YdcH (DUF465 family)
MKENKQDNAHFLRIFDQHNELDDQVKKAENGEVAMGDIELETLKKKKLLLKDEAYGILMNYKKENNL